MVGGLAELIQLHRITGVFFGQLLEFRVPVQKMLANFRDRHRHSLLMGWWRYMSRR
jgi:hypothetical protein